MDGFAVLRWNEFVDAEEDFFVPKRDSSTLDGLLLYVKRRFGCDEIGSGGLRVSSSFSSARGSTRGVAAAARAGAASTRGARASFSSARTGRRWSDDRLSRGGKKSKRVAAEIMPHFRGDRAGEGAHHAHAVEVSTPRAAAESASVRSEVPSGDL